MEDIFCLWFVVAIANCPFIKTSRTEPPSIRDTKSEKGMLSYSSCGVEKCEKREKNKKDKKR